MFVPCAWISASGAWGASQGNPLHTGLHPRRKKLHDSSTLFPLLFPPGRATDLSDCAIIPRAIKSLCSNQEEISKERLDAVVCRKQPLPVRGACMPGRFVPCVKTVRCYFYSFCQLAWATFSVNTQATSNDSERGSPYSEVSGCSARGCSGICSRFSNKNKAAYWLSWLEKQTHTFCTLWAHSPAKSTGKRF